MKANYVHKDTLTATDYVELNKNNELLISYNQALLKENQELKKKYENAVADYETVMFENKQLKDKLELLINDLKINKEKEKEEGKSYFNTDLVAIRVLEIYKILKGSDSK